MNLCEIKVLRIFTNFSNKKIFKIVIIVEYNFSVRLDFAWYTMWMYHIMRVKQSKSSHK